MPVCSRPPVASSVTSTVNTMEYCFVLTSIADQMNWNIFFVVHQIPAFFLLQSGAPFSPEVFLSADQHTTMAPLCFWERRDGGSGRDGVGGWVEPVCLLRSGSNSFCVIALGAIMNGLLWPAFPFPPLLGCPTTVCTTVRKRKDCFCINTKY